ncbi:deoxynucleoside kinase [Spirosoma sp. BT702]|uniref:Deoxynucleoside kinase n=1 Tax=Spirosoma profusum TaxID=2771354 RepID=A0A926Y1G5_9BACT|nr:deoxynucleoside kinase [Spirosoma profusum]MBD2704215.1 deoxynucleoside kinase [Spirosoma profusum]
MHIAITGNIGAGKTTLAQMMAAHYKWDVLYEAVEGNPYLADFYADMRRWSFNLQIFFLNSRFAQMKKIVDNQQVSREKAIEPTPMIQDRTIYEDAAIFARNLYQRGDMSERDYLTYRQVFENMMSLVRPPDLMIYLRASLPRLRQRIQKRGRNYEQAISDTYLADLNQLYEEFVTTYQLGPLLILNVDTLDYVTHPSDFDAILQQIDAKLTR